MSDLEILRQLMPPVTESDTSVDWEQLHGSWHKEFPADYRQFVELYGSGTIQDYLVIYAPEYRNELSKPALGGMLHESVNAEHQWATVEKSPELSGVSPGLIAWGVGADADILCWDASSKNPNAWPILVYKRNDILWRRYNCGMVKFLVQILKAGFDECPLGGLDLWGRQTATFLTMNEEKRRLRQGLDPWTGEPDPYAGMYNY